MSATNNASPQGLVASQFQLEALENFVRSNDFVMDPPIDPAILGAVHPPQGNESQAANFEPAPETMAAPARGVVGGLVAVAPNPNHPAVPPSTSTSTSGAPRPSNGKSDDLKRQFAENEHRPLASVLDDLRKHLTSQEPAEVDRTKSLFGMLWVKENCRRNSQKSVARDSVHSQYRHACLEARVTELNSANFGKCVRTVFPNIKVRRLGPRGGSKYNYSGMELVNPPEESALPSANSQRSIRAESTPAPLGPPQHPAAVSSTPPLWTSMKTVSYDTVFIDTNLLCDHADNRVERLLLIDAECERPATDEAMSLPDASPYVPSGVEYQDVSDFVAVYRAAAVRIIELFRKLSKPKLYKALSRFPLRLSEKDRRIMDDPIMAPWVEAVDTQMYQQMTLLLPRLIFVELGDSFEAFRSMSAEGLTRTLGDAYSAFSLPCRRAKLRPARLFEEILRKFVKAYEAVTHVVPILSDPSVMRRMREDWTTTVERDQLLDSQLPTCRSAEVLNILEHDIGQLLDPEKTISLGSDDGTQRALLRWADLVKTLPIRFPDAATTKVISVVKLIGMSVLQQVREKGCQTFDHWWDLILWLNAMLDFFAVVGGFLFEGRDHHFHRGEQHHQRMDALGEPQLGFADSNEREQAAPPTETKCSASSAASPQRTLFRQAEEEDHNDSGLCLEEVGL